PRSMPPSLRMAAGSWRRTGAGLVARGLGLEPWARPFYGGEQVVDVVALEQPLAQRVERRALLAGGRAVLAVPPRAQLLKLPLVLLALRVDGRARLLEPGAQLPGIRSPFAQLANLVELLVERKHFLEQRRRDL